VTLWNFLPQRQSQSFSLASEMWSKVHDMHAKQQRDREMRVWIWIVELVVLVLTIFVSVRIGTPDVMCPELDDSSSSRLVR
jgi:hypothetical protein